MLEQRSPFHNETIFLTCDDPFKTSDRAPSNSQEDLRYETPVWIPRREPVSPVLEPITVAGENGSELTIDQNNSVRSFTDAAGRQFAFAYDSDSGELNKLSNETGTWTRMRTFDGRYLNSWMNDETTQMWSGHMLIGKGGFSMSNPSERIVYSPCGTKTVDHLIDGEVYARKKEDALGNISLEDTRTQKIHYTFVDGRSAVRNLVDGSLLGYDAAGRMTVMYDAGGRKFEFQDYDENGKPHLVSNERGTWTEVAHQIWCNQENNRYWYGDVEVDKNGVYTYTEVSGKTVSRYCNGYAVEEYGGIRTLTYANGKRTRQYIDGQEFKEPPLMGSARFNVKDGITTGCKLHLERGEVSSVNDAAGTHVAIQLNPNSPVGAFQDGIVIYSSRQPEASDRRQPVVELTGNDLSVLDHFRQNSDVVVLQCYDKVAHGIRYEIYCGFDQANVVTGDRVKAAQPIGRVGEDGTLRFAVKRNSVSGLAVPISTDV